jgi:acyl carrier protein
MITVADAKKRAAESLVGFPARITNAYYEFAENGDPEKLDVVVLGVLLFYLAKKPQGTLDALPGTTRLIEDLGCDSLAMLDTVFMIESLFDMKLDDVDLARIKTLDDLRLYLRRQAGPQSAPVA